MVWIWDTFCLHEPEAWFHGAPEVWIIYMILGILMHLYTIHKYLIGLFSEINLCMFIFEHNSTNDCESYATTVNSVTIARRLMMKSNTSALIKMTSNRAISMISRNLKTFSSFPFREYVSFSFVYMFLIRMSNWIFIYKEIWEKRPTIKKISYPPKEKG